MVKITSFAKISSCLYALIRTIVPIFTIVAQFLQIEKKIFYSYTFVKDCIFLSKMVSLVEMLFSIFSKKEGSNYFKTHVYQMYFKQGGE